MRVVYAECMNKEIKEHSDSMAELQMLAVCICFVNVFL